MTQVPHSGIAEVGALLAEAEAAWREGRLERAEALCRHVLSARPDISDAWHILALVAMSLNRIDVAAHCVAMAIEREPSFLGYVNTAGIIANLRGLPDTRFRFLAMPQGSASTKVSAFMAARGIDPVRLDFAGVLPKPAYYQAIAAIGLMLDSYPYNGGTTTLETLWSGTPIISFAGGPMVSRMGLGLLNTIGLGALATENHAAYIGLTCEISRDPFRIDALRSEVRDCLLASPLTGTAGFTRKLESAYLNMLRSGRDTAPSAG